MANFTQLPSGNWRVQVRRKKRYVAETFRRRKDGEEWALDIERNIDRSGSPKPKAAFRVRTFGDLIDLHVKDMKEVGRPPRRSKAAVLEALKETLGTVKLTQLNRERLIEFGRNRAKQGAGPATLAIDFAFIRTVATHAAAVHGIEVSAEEVRLARFAMKHLGLVGRSEERDRRPTQDELDELIEYFESNRRQPPPHAAEYFDEIQGVKITKDMLNLAKHIVQQKSGHFEPEKFEDHYEQALQELLDQKRKGLPIATTRRPAPSNVFNLMDALKQSIKSGDKAKPTTKPVKAKKATAKPR